MCILFHNWELVYVLDRGYIEIYHNTYIKDHRFPYLRKHINVVTSRKYAAKYTCADCKRSKTKTIFSHNTNSDKLAAIDIYLHQNNPS